VNWFAQHWQEWILEMLGIYGFVSRIHVVRKFNIRKYYWRERK